MLVVYFTKESGVATKQMTQEPNLCRKENWTELLPLLNTPARAKAIRIVAARLDEDAKLMREGKPVSSLGMLVPSENASSPNTIQRAKILRRALGMSSQEYRKLRAALRRYIGVVA
jgi:hypothetical protein